MYTFKLKFKDRVSLEEKLKIISDVHTAIYGSISLNDEPEINKHYINSDIRTALADNILKDRRIDSVYNFVKYINKDAFKDVDVTQQNVKYLTQEDERYKKIKSICSNEIMNMDPENPKLYELYELMQDESIFGNLFKTTHSRLRFITRFVLKNPTSPLNLSYKCRMKLHILRKELDLNLKNYNIICYEHKKGYSPQFYHYNSKLGKYIKITINSSGNIHTIYEDQRKVLKEQEKKIEQEKEKDNI